MRTTLIFGAVLSLVAVCGMQIVSLHRANTQLRAQVDEKRALLEKRTVKADRSVPAVAARSERAGASTGTTNETLVRTVQLQSEVAALEKKAAEHYAASPEATDAPSANRDPEKGMTKLEYMQNVGQGTPAAALQTLFWAALKGDDQVIARTVAWDETVRPQVQALIDRLPEVSKARYSTPEQLWALIFSRQALDVSAIQIVETAMKDAANASLAVKGLTTGDIHLSMHLGPSGWQLRVGEWHLRMVSNELTGKKEN